MFFNISINKTIKYFEEVDDITAMSVRLSMKYFGWDSEDRIDADQTKNDDLYHIKFTRNDWPGICFETQTKDVGKINQITKECAMRALKTYLDKENISE